MCIKGKDSCFQVLENQNKRNGKNVLLTHKKYFFIANNYVIKIKCFYSKLKIFWYIFLAVNNFTMVDM